MSLKIIDTNCDWLHDFSGCYDDRHFYVYDKNIPFAMHVLTSLSDPVSSFHYFLKEFDTSENLEDQKFDLSYFGSPIEFRNGKLDYTFKDENLAWYDDSYDRFRDPEFLAKSAYDCLGKSISHARDRFLEQFCFMKEFLNVYGDSLDSGAYDAVRSNMQLSERFDSTGKDLGRNGIFADLSDFGFTKSDPGSYHSFIREKFNQEDFPVSFGLVVKKEKDDYNNYSRTYSLNICFVETFDDHDKPGHHDRHYHTYRPFLSFSVDPGKSVFSAMKESFNAEFERVSKQLEALNYFDDCFNNQIHDPGHDILFKSQQLEFPSDVLFKDDEEEISNSSGYFMVYDKPDLSSKGEQDFFQEYVSVVVDPFRSNPDGGSPGRDEPAATGLSEQTAGDKDSADAEAPDIDISLGE